MQGLRLHLKQLMIERERESESEDSVEITFQILIINNVILRPGWVTVIHSLMSINHC